MSLHHRKYFNMGVVPNGYQSTRHTVKSSHGHLVTRSIRHKWAHNKAISCQRGSAHCSVKTVLNTDNVIIKTSRRRHMGGGCWKLMTNKEKKTEGLEMTVKLLEKYLVWKKTKWIIIEHVCSQYSKLIGSKETICDMLDILWVSSGTDCAVMRLAFSQTHSRCWLFGL